MLTKLENYFYASHLSDHAINYINKHYIIIIIISQLMFYYFHYKIDICNRASFFRLNG